MDLSSVKPRPRNLSPHEEFQQRSTYVATRQKLADSDIPMLLNHTRYATVKACAICFEDGGVTHRFRAINALSCQPSMNGKKVLIHWVRDFPDAVFVMTSDLKHVETVPRVGKVKWFDHDATSRELHEQRTQLNRLSDELAELHKEETAEQAAATQRNIERVQSSNALQTTYSFPASHPSPRNGSELPTEPSATLADALNVPDSAQDTDDGTESEPLGGFRSRNFGHRNCRPGDAINEEINRQRSQRMRAGESQRATKRVLQAAAVANSAANTRPKSAGNRGIMGILMARSQTLNKSQED